MLFRSFAAEWSLFGKRFRLENPCLSTSCLTHRLTELRTVWRTGSLQTPRLTLLVSRIPARHTVRRIQVTAIKLSAQRSTVLCLQLVLLRLSPDSRAGDLFLRSGFNGSLLRSQLLFSDRTSHRQPGLLGFRRSSGLR